MPENKAIVSARGFKTAQIKQSTAADHLAAGIRHRKRDVQTRSKTVKNPAISIL
jgi:hypothetical protein